MSNEIYKSKLLLVVPLHNGDQTLHAGGQLTAATGLVHFLEKNGIEVQTVNTVEKVFPSAGILKKTFRSALRIINVIYLLCTNRYTGSILFTGFELSFIERIILCISMRLFRIKSILFFRSSSILFIDPMSLKGILLKFALKIPDCILVQGKACKEHLASFDLTKDKVSILRNWVPPAIRIAQKTKTVSEDTVVHFIFTGWLVPVKGIYEITRAIELLIHNNLDFKFSFIGGGTLEYWLREQHAKLRWGNRVVITGWKNAQEIDKLLDTAHVFVLPTYHREGFPNALLEAFAKGLPAISTNVGAIPDSLFNGKNGFIIPPKDPDTLFKAMKKYIMDPQIIATQSHEVLDVVKTQHNLNSNCQVIADIFSIEI